MNEEKKPVNPHAFAAATDGPNRSFCQEGMTLRDYFAGQALSGVCANNTVSEGLMLDGKDVSVQDFCYGLADAMLKARQS